MKNRSVLNSPRLLELKRKKRRILERKIIFFCSAFLILFVGLGFISRIPALNIKNITVSGNKILEAGEIEKVAREEISRKFLWLFLRSNFIIYPQHKIEKELKDKFKRIKNISVNDRNIKTLEINISEYEGKYLWCGEMIPILDISGIKKCYFLDENGYVFDEAPFFSGAVYFKFYGQNKGDILGTYFIEDIWTNFVIFKENLEKMNLKPTAFWLDEKGEGNIALSSEPMEGPRILFKIDSNYEKIAENLQSALDTEPLRSDFQNKFSSLLYLDLRFENKVYYKFK